VLAAKREERYHDVFNVKQETRVTFNDLAERYVENYQGQKCFPRLKYYLVDEYRAVIGDRLLSQITFLDLETYRNQRKPTPTRSGKPRTDATVNREMSTLRHMFNKAVECGLLETSPFARGKRLMFQENNHRLRFLSDAEVEALLEAFNLIRANSPHRRPIVETALLTGMRREELLSLKREQIRNGFIYLTETKSGKARQIPINDHLSRILRELRRENQLRSPYGFCDSRGRRYQEVKRCFASACRRAGITGFRFHDLRHTCASHLVMKGASLKVVQELLGHSDLKMTMRYAHLSQEHLKDSVNLLNDLPACKQTVNDAQKGQKAENLPITNPSISLTK
jgi:integrase